MRNLTGAQKKVISNIFRDLAKLTVIALVVGQFVPAHVFNIRVFFGGLFSAFLMGMAAVQFAVDTKEEGF